MPNSSNATTEMAFYRCPPGLLPYPRISTSQLASVLQGPVTLALATQDQLGSYLLERVGGAGRASQVVLQNVCEEREGLSERRPGCVRMQLHAFPPSSSVPACVWVSAYTCQCLQMVHVYMHVRLHTCM